MTVDTKHHNLVIDVGSLRGMASLHRAVVGPLQQFSRMYLAGIPPRVSWDLRGVVPGKMSMSAIAALVAVADRLRVYTEEEPEARLPFDRQVLDFWRQIDLFDIVDEWGLFSLPDAVRRDHAIGMINPSTKLYGLPAPPAKPVSQPIIQWKESQREALTNDFLRRFKLIFEPLGSSNQRLWRLRHHVAMAAAELVVNAWLWGHSSAIVGVQRSTDARISVAVCDSGRGLIESLREQTAKPIVTAILDHLDAIMIASLINWKVFGLRKAITQVTDAGGWVSISSFDAEVVWRQELWREVQSLFPARGNAEDGKHVEMEALRQAIGPPVDDRATDAHRHRGFSRRFPSGLRGVRISFEL